jgi:outer membrane protein assembly factor BamB
LGGGHPGSFSSGDNPIIHPPSQEELGNTSDPGAFDNAGDPWTMSRHDLSHTGYSTSSVPDEPSVLWTSQENDVIYSSPTIAYDMVYFGSGKGDFAIEAVDEFTGDLVWRFPTGHYVDGSPAAADGMVIVGSVEGTVFALDAFSGALMWSYDREATLPSEVSAYFHSSPAIESAEGRVYIGVTLNNHDTDDEWQEFLCLDMIDGHKIWDRTEITKAVHLADPAVSGDSVFTAMGNRVLSLDKLTGDIIWQYSTPGSVFFTAPTIADGTLFIQGYNDGWLNALDISDGSLKWRHKFDRGMGTSSTAYHDGVLFVGGARDSTVYAFNAVTGAVIWEYVADAYCWGSPAVADGTVLISCHDEYLYALDENDGSLLWRFLVGYRPLSGPSVADGIVFAGNHDGVMYALGGGEPPSGDVDATVDCDPDSLNLRSNGKWITCYVELPSGLDPRDIDPTTVLLNDVLSPNLDPKYGFVKSEESYIVDHNNDGTEERMFKFDRSEVGDMLPTGVDVVLVITGELLDGTGFEGSDTINVFNAPGWGSLNRSETSWIFWYRYA